MSLIMCRTEDREQSQELAIAVALILTKVSWSRLWVLKGEILKSFSLSFNSAASNSSRAGIHAKKFSLSDFLNLPKKGQTNNLPYRH